MPAKSKAQQALFAMALAVRRGEMKRSEVNKEVLDLADSDITTKDLEDFARTKHKGLKDHVSEALHMNAILNKTPRVFIVIKPEFLHLSQKVLKEFEDKGFKVIAQKLKQLTLPEAKRLYFVHHKEDFYNDLCKYMSSGLSLGIVLTHENKDDLFDVVSKIKDNVRKEYGVSDMKNVIHGSDSLENMEKESRIYF